MKLVDVVGIDHEDRRSIYAEIEESGAVRRDELMRGRAEDRRAVGHHLAVLERDGYIAETDDGMLQLAVDPDAGTDFRTDGIEVTVRPAVQRDLTGIVGAIRQVAEELTYIEAETVADVVESEEVLLRHNELESRMFFVATVDDDVVGWVHLNSRELEKLDHTAKLTIGVLEGHRGQGVGSELLAAALEWAVDNGIGKVYNSVPASNEGAIAFLEAHGWETEAVREDHYRIGDRYVDEVMMATRP